MRTHKTVVAISTGAAAGGIGVVRLSGPNSVAIARQVFKGKNIFDRSHLLRWGQVWDGEEVLDEGLAVLMRAPHSFTGEDVVELHLHGNPMLLRRVVDLCCAKGAELASPGEFSKRAYLNGKMDLTKAEAVCELITAESLAAAKQAALRLQGHLAAFIEDLEQRLLALLAECEADIDFPDENLTLQERPALIKSLTEVSQGVGELLATYRQVERARSGLQVLFLGRPNVGKSSLFNALLGQERALVSAQAGTTRDVLREVLDLEGFRVYLLDAAGVRSHSQDELEKAGMERTLAAGQQADVVCILCPVDEQPGAEEAQWLSEHGEKCLWLWTKADLAGARASTLPADLGVKQVWVSAHSGQGLAQLRECLAKDLCEDPRLAATGGVQNDRQRAALEAAAGALGEAELLWSQGQAIELAASHLREALENLAQVLGKDKLSDEILAQIFAKFCIGK